MTNVNNQNNQRIFQFIASQNIQLSEADTNDDGAISKKELKTFLEETLGFDYALLEGWDGTDKSQNDLFNQFFKSINTDTSTRKIDGTKERNSKALDSKEIEMAEKRIAVQSYLDKYIEENLNNLPDFISNQSALKNEIAEKLEALVEKKLMNNSKAISEEDVKNFLDENINKVKNQAIAVLYASEYMTEAVNEYTEKYEYKVNDDKALQKLIKDFIAQVNGDYSVDQIKDGIEALIENYINTAKAGENNGTKAVLNDLQKAVLKVNLTKAITATVESNTLYQANKDAYDAEIAKFVASKLSGLQNFQGLLDGTIVLEEFAKQQKSIESNIQAQNIFSNEEILNAIKNDEKLGELIAEKIQYIMPGELASLDKIKEEVANKIKKGEFLNADGSLNISKISAFVISELRAIISELYGDDSDGLSVAELENIYDAQVSAAKSKGNSQAIKTAAKDFCKAIINKGDAYKKAVEEIFGSNYSSKIDNTYAYLVQNMIARLMENIKDLKEPIEVTDKSYKVKNAMKGQTSYTGNLDFYVNDKGEIVFVSRSREAHGAFNANNTSNATLNTKMSALKSELEKVYSSDLSNIKLTEKQKSTLFNVALFTALSDPTVVRSQYEQTTSIDKLVNAVIENYTKLLQKVAKDENAMKFIENYATNSLLAGRTPAPADNYTYGAYETIQLHGDCKKGIQRYYTDDSTYGNDDWVRPSDWSSSSASHTHNGHTITIIEYTTVANTSENSDAAVFNRAMQLLADDYVDTYGSMIDVNRLCELFRQAEEEAMNKMKTVNDAGKSGNCSIYGYGETGRNNNEDRSDNFDTMKTDEGGTLINIGNIILQVMFEMERLIALEIMK